jgi:hypothetical protein
MRKVIRHRADLTDEQIRQELAAREAADAEARLMRRPILDAFRAAAANR